jgi:hypothetical protein
VVAVRADHQKRVDLDLSAVRSDRPLQVSVTRLPLRHSEEVEALLRVAQQFRRTDWNRAAVGVIAGFYLWLGVTLFAAPHALSLAAAGDPAFSLFAPQVWALAFLTGGVLAGLLAWQVTAVRQVAAWMIVFPVQTTWLAASVLAVTHHDGGSSLAIAVWTAIFAFTVLVALRLGIEYTTGKR